MYGIRGRRDKPNTLLDRYGARLGSIVEHNRAELALLAAKQNAETSAKVARSAMVDAQTADRAKTEFLANMSHELRTPLNAIIGFSEMMIMGLVGPDKTGKHLEYARDIHESGHHLLELINDILDLAKVEAGKLELDQQFIGVSRITDSCITLIRERAFESGLMLHHEIMQDGVLLCVDQRKIKQVLINLLSNAVKFTPEGGMVVLSGGREADGSYLLKVSDTGIGIARENICEALAPFTQVDSDLARSYEGTGLGLPLSKALVELHGGTLTIDSEVGVGTTVAVWLPPERVRVDEALALQAATDPAGAAESARVKERFIEESMMGGAP